MILLSEYIAAIDGVNITPVMDAAKIELSSGYVCDMLSDVMGSAKSGQAWITIMKHLNVIAVASMTGIPVIIFAKSSNPDQAVIDKAVEEEICLVQSSKTAFELSGILYQMLN
ncbi:MAG: hypothetical protein CVU48_00080 [Candidatus Cloacimonetes bacterium HGW-Cloacimonetes-1]|jgi:hypothetical protein|nr:MAG: hypothetical protein CVU48_00080 [Candidatus Cloacimonetes bacterium HGW-Cloacimonetes-1]